MVEEMDEKRYSSLWDFLDEPNQVVSCYTGNMKLMMHSYIKVVTQPIKYNATVFLEWLCLSCHRVLFPGKK